MPLLPNIDRYIALTVDKVGPDNLRSNLCAGYVRREGQDSGNNCGKNCGSSEQHLTYLPVTRKQYSKEALAT